MDLIAHLGSDPAVQHLAALLGQGRRVYARGSHGASTPFLAAAVARLTARPTLLVVGHLDEADESLDELLEAGVDAIRLPALEALPGESAAALDLFVERLACIRRLRAQQPLPDVIIAPVQALMQPAPAPDALGAVARTLVRGQHISPAELIAWLHAAGFTRTDAIEEPGEYTQRGGIIDLFLPTTAAAAPGAPPAAAVRLDFFGDELEKIAEIDLDTMGSDRALNQVEIVCADIAKALGQSAPPEAAEPAHRPSPRPGRNAARRLSGRAQAPGESSPIQIGVSFLDYLPAPGSPDAPVAILHETLEITEQARGYFERLRDGGGEFFGPPAVFQALQVHCPGLVEINQLSDARLPSDLAVDLPVRTLPPLPSDIAAGLKDLETLVHAPSTHAPPPRTPGEGPATPTPSIVISCSSDAERARLGELMREHAPRLADSPRCTIQTAYISRGFIWHGEHAPPLHVIPYHELIHRFETRGRAGRRRRGHAADGARLKAGRAMESFLDFAPGDYVVHRDHGIGLFVGLTTMAAREIKRAAPVVLPSEKPRAKHRSGRADDDDVALEEYLTIEFSGASRLHVPCTTIDLVQKYIGGFKGAPPLATLGGTRWKKQTQAVAESVKDLAGELLRIRAARGHLPGVRYPADTPWQAKFEDEFPFQETDDQLAALAEIKKDMQTERPMDRLLCGDVGYGKTELAVRAAFKAVEFGKQAAVLVPTTVLAEQHERTFRSRFAGYPFRVESLSRFKTDQEINKTLADLRKGQIDVIIGTHRLVSKDVKFADLGLVIIDEEQRFGVEHKERLLALRLTVDVLTLSATPIPRTLHMSMLGIRDISSLSTPPLDRRAVVTEVIPFNARRVQQAIRRELAREGQVFYVHNRVHDILSKADDLQKLVPDARIVVGHGQMPDRELEQVMLAFFRRDADILVSTTIIESGIDVPTANTMIIDDADRFGLADLHQLRGRVGRYKHRAYCYLLLPHDRTVAEKAVKRLKAIEEFSMLGAGFKIAMRDLEIRGAGNILGPEQSGHIAAVGYEMYCHLLETAVHELKNEPVKSASRTSVELGVHGLIPKTYILSDLRRMDAYRRIATAAHPSDVDRIERELIDAYGRFPSSQSANDGSAQTGPIGRLLDLARVRAAASQLSVRSIAVRDKDVIFRVEPARSEELAALLRDRTDTAQRTSARPPLCYVTVLPGPPDALSEVFFRPPERFLEPASLLTVLRRRLVEPADVAGTLGRGRL